MKNLESASLIRLLLSQYQTTMYGSAVMPLSLKPFGNTLTGLPIELICVSNHELVAEFISLGATLKSIKPVGAGPDAKSLCLGFSEPSGYINDRNYTGVTVGPVANRIGQAYFSINGVGFELEANEGSTCLHSGSSGFQRSVWRVEDVDEGSAEVVFSLHRNTGAGGFPGNAEITVSYRLDGHALVYTWSAISDAATPMALTNHSYWNLARKGRIDNHYLMVEADRVVEVDQWSLPTGQLVEVAGSKYDFLTPTRLAYELDTCFCLDGKAVLQGGDVTMTVQTSLPGVQVYTGQFLPNPGSGVCLETQHYPDAVNQPHFPSPIIEPGQRVTHTTRYSFEFS